MRLLFVFIGLLLPQVLWAQFFNSFEPGSYRLVNSPGVRHQGQLKLRGNDQLVVEDADGKKTRFAPQEVASFQMGGHKYVTAGNFTLGSGPFIKTVDLAFVERLDSGYVSLLRYTYPTGGAPMVGAGGAMVGGGGSTGVLYLLKWVQEADVSPIPSSGLLGGGKKFREALQRHLANRPDLTELLEAKRFTTDDLPGIVHALNTGTDYVPAPLPDTAH
ncbi:hypothetical protein ACFQ48_19875 [Hymenobacter caeli]|uniref:DUF4369 domain-containing protein n=1 Tax=Hymenobacter caeli TaxID=2735894 RepID=A0ABX2FW28_9BACT|nr:hypothetical protein [Hymenobacter caeli]NRT21221.1 hypothetical protein [Hymenobacter caeli]